MCILLFRFCFLVFFGAEGLVCVCGFLFNLVLLLFLWFCFGGCFVLFCFGGVACFLLVGGFVIWDKFCLVEDYFYFIFMTSIS